jgi:hypothetical protein
VVANGLAAEKTKIYSEAIKRAISNPEYVMKEIRNKNPLAYKVGDEMWKALRESEAFVKSVRYWES